MDAPLSQLVIVGQVSKHLDQYLHHFYQFYHEWLLRSPSGTAYFPNLHGRLLRELVATRCYPFCANGRDNNEPDTPRHECPLAEETEVHCPPDKPYFELKIFNPWKKQNSFFTYHFPPGSWLAVFFLPHSSLDEIGRKSVCLWFELVETLVERSNGLEMKEYIHIGTATPVRNELNSLLLATFSIAALAKLKWTREKLTLERDAHEWPSAIRTKPCHQVPSVGKENRTYLWARM